MSNNWLARHALAFAILAFAVSAQAQQSSTSEGGAPANNSHAGNATIFSKSTLSYRTKSGRSLEQSVIIAYGSLVINYTESSIRRGPQKFHLEAPVAALRAGRPVAGPIEDVPSLKRVYTVIISCRRGKCINAATPSGPRQYVTQEVVFDNERDANAFYGTLNGL